MKKTLIVFLLMLLPGAILVERAQAAESECLISCRKKTDYVLEDCMRACRNMPKIDRGSQFDNFNLRRLDENSERRGPAPITGGPMLLDNEYNVRAPGCPKGMVRIDAGEFTMGCSSRDTACRQEEKPTRMVRISGDFCIDEYEVTQRDFASIMRTNPSEFTECGTDECPVDSVIWIEAWEYCRRLNARLPTEAEWEAAARSGAGTQYPWGSTMDGEYAWFADNTIPNGLFSPQPIGQKLSNDKGLYDMAGNVEEWVQDCFDDQWYYKMPATDPRNDGMGCRYRVLRGGNWASPADALRVSHRGWSRPDFRSYYYGFRCAANARPVLYK